MHDRPQPSHRHHYVPQFYLRQWSSGPDGKVWCYKRERSGRLSEKRVVPKGTGFQDHLYSMRRVTPFLREPATDVIERDFLSPLDNASAYVLQKLLRGHEQSLSAEERAFWALFLNSLLERNPRTLRARDEIAPGVAEEVLAEVRAKCDSVESSARLDALIRRLDYVGMARNAIREHMVHEIRDERVLNHFLSRSWRVVTLGPETELITSDSPLVLNCGRSKAPIDMLALSLSPNKLFLSYPPTWDVDDELLKRIVFIHNLLLVRGEGEFLYSMCRLEDGPIVQLRQAAERFFGRCSDLDDSERE